VGLEHLEELSYLASAVLIVKVRPIAKECCAFVETPIIVRLSKPVFHKGPAYKRIIDCLQLVVKQGSFSVKASADFISEKSEWIAETN
jgi:hypothetical protein